jgi:hypothetical protein
MCLTSESGGIAADDDGGDGVTKKPDEVCSGALGKPFFGRNFRE